MKNLLGDGDYWQADRLFGFEFSRKVQIQVNPQFREQQARFLIMRLKNPRVKQLFSRLPQHPYANSYADSYTPV
jgi:hypothetical protein